MAESTGGTPIPIKRPAAAVAPVGGPVSPQATQGEPVSTGVGQGGPVPVTPAQPVNPPPPPPTPPPAMAPAGINPTWTASIQMTENGAQTTETPAASPVGPPPLGTSTASVRPQPVEPSKVSIPTTKTPPPPAASETEPLPATPPASPELTIPTTPVERPVPWRPIAIGAISLLVVGAIAYALWWFGLGFGAPYHPQTALTKMRAALAAHPAYHTEGTLGLTLETGNSTTNVPARAELPARSDRGTISELRSLNSDLWTLIPVVRALEPVLESETATIPTFPELPQTYGLRFAFQADQASNTLAAASFAIDLSGLGDLLPPTYPTTIEMEIRRLGDELYLRLPILSLLVGGESNTWLLLDAADATALAEEAGTETPLTFEHLVAASTSARRVGFERIGPVRTAHYSVEIDLTKLLVGLGIEPSDVGLNLSMSQPLTFDWWMGMGDHRPYQMTLSGAITSDDVGAVLKLNARTSYSRYDVTPVVTAPDPSQVIDGGLEGLLGTDVADARIKARDAQRKSDLRALESALAIYHSDHGRYPSTAGAIERTDQPKVLTALVTEGYFHDLPVDPLAEQYWYGYKSTDGIAYEVWSILEDETDPDGVLTGELFLYTLTSED